MNTRVSSEELRDSARVFAEAGERARESYTQTLSLLQGLSSVFRAKPVTNALLRLEELSEEGERSLHALCSRAEELMEIAAEYEAAERRNTDVAGSVEASN